MKPVGAPGEPIIFPVLTGNLFVVFRGILPRLILLAALVLTGACRSDSNPKSRAAVDLGAIPPAAASLLTRAKMAFREGQYDVALRGANEAIRRAPHFERAHLTRGLNLRAWTA